MASFASLMVSRRRFRNGRDDMAKKRSKRASKTSAVRGERRGRARATPTQRRAQPKGMINAREDDPGGGDRPSGGEVIHRPNTVLRDQPRAIRIVAPGSAPVAQRHPPGAAECRHPPAAEAVRRGAGIWRALRPDISWEAGFILPVDLDFGIDLHAFDDHQGSKF